MKLFNSIAVVGTGLIGGSIALAAKKNKLAYRVIGVSRSERTIRLAKKIGAIDAGSTDISIIKEADFVILATPVGTILDLATRISKSVNRHALVTDVGSSKLEITCKLEKIFPYFVGSHPLAGSEKRGIDYACPDLFKSSLCILTPTKNTDNKSLGKVRKFWRILGAKVLCLSPQDHDKALSFVSHLPHAVAFSLIDSVPEKYLKFGASGLRDTTRISASDSGLWSDIFLSNRHNLEKAIGEFIRKLSKIKSAIGTKNKKALVNILEESKKKRELL